MQERKVTWVDRIKAPAKGQLDTKAKFPGLYVRTFAPRATSGEGRKVWFFKGRLLGGSSKFVLLGQYPAMDERNAEKAAAHARWKMSQGIDPNAERAERMLAAKAASITFAALVDEYLREGIVHRGRQLADTTRGLYKTVLYGKHLEPWHSGRFQRSLRTKSIA
jgi:hypothetical protein